jgi:hypothetical protein
MAMTVFATTYVGELWQAVAVAPARSEYPLQTSGFPGIRPRSRFPGFHRENHGGLGTQWAPRR